MVRDLRHSLRTGLLRRVDCLATTNLLTAPVKATEAGFCGKTATCTVVILPMRSQKRTYDA
ncbi:MAG: hypothetical protein B7X78_06500 [Sphingomonadales bacterium 39-62-4]|nr:MAG: hypothetical protein B7X78_06500 [Sphingomonadales bacterium 39-62-4]